MKIFITGGAGPLGRRVLKALVRDHHAVTAAMASAEEVRLAQNLGARSLKVNLLNVVDTQVATYGQEVILNLTGGLGPRTWKKAHAVRRAISLNLVHAALKNHVGRFIEESSTRVYRDNGRDWIGEEGAVKTDPVSYSIRAMERNVLELEKAGAVPVILRMAQIYAADDKETRRMLKWARLGYFAELEPLLGFLPRIHADDAASAVVCALRATSGVFNICEDEPSPRGQSARMLAEALGRRSLLRPPFWLSALARPKEPQEGSLLLSNRRFKAATGWKPSYPSPKEGWGVLVEQAAR
jgi:nucleoside-diphosphate-sugar epimerase